MQRKRRECSINAGIVRRKGRDCDEKAGKTAFLAAKEAESQRFRFGIRFDITISVPRKQSCYPAIGISELTAERMIS